MTNTFARRLRHCRHTQGFSLRQLGMHLGVSFSTIARIERGDGEPDAHTRLILLRWMRPEESFPPCMCVRCSAVGTIKSRLERVEETLQRLVDAHPELGIYV